MVRTIPLGQADGVEDRPKAMGLFARLKTESLVVVPVTSDHFVTAARFADQYGLGLRAADSLHIAVAAEHGDLHAGQAPRQSRNSARRQRRAGVIIPRFCFFSGLAGRR
jgi:hypothetical protein